MLFHGFPPMLFHGFPPGILRSFPTTSFPQFSKEFEYPEVTRLSVNSLPHRITHRIPHKFPPRYFISPVSRNKGPLMVVINGYKEHTAAMNPLMHIASVPPYCALHFWSSQQLFWNISVSRGSFPSESGRWRKTPAISRQVIPPIGKCSPERRQAARMSHPGNST